MIHKLKVILNSYYLSSKFYILDHKYPLAIGLALGIAVTLLVT
jgi:hypothetical protein